MHTIRRREKYIAWYDDPVDDPSLLKNPFAQIPINNSKLAAISRRAPTLVGVSAHSKETDHPERSASGLPPASGPTEKRVEKTNDSIDIESTSDIEYPLRRRLPSLVTTYLNVIGRVFQPAGASEKQSATSSQRALQAAETAFKNRVKSQAILAELTFVNVTQDSSSINDDLSAQGLDKTQVAISSIQPAKNIDLEAIRKSTRRGVKILYIFDNEPLSKSLVTSSFVRPVKDRGWRRFRDWAENIHQRRGAMRKSAHWFPPRMNKAQRLEFALGLEHCASFSPGKDQNNHKGLLEEITTIRDLGRYEETSFAKISPVHRRALYFYELDTSIGDSVNVTSDKGGTIFEKDRQFLMIIAQSKPCHYQTDEPGYSSWTDYSYWRSLLDPYTGVVQHNDLELCYHGLVRDIVSGVLREADEAWNARILELVNDVEILASQVYDNPSDIASSDHLWNLSQYLSEMQQAIGSQAELMELIQEEMQAYAADRASNSDELAAKLWLEISKDAWLEALIKEMKDSEQSVQDGLIREVDRLLDRVYKTVSINDVRRSIELNESLWRLSWVTFIFLPMTFLAGFFGMNVNIFSDNPDIKWYFIAVVPFMIVVLLLWVLFRFALGHWVSLKTLRMRRFQRRGELVST